MMRWTKIAVCVGMIAGAGLLAAAAMQPKQPASAAAKGMPVLVIQEVETDSPKSYAMWMAEVNKVFKDKLGLENYRHVFIGESAGPDTGKVFAVTRDESFAKLTANQAAMEKEAAMTDARMNLKDIRKLGPNVVYRAARWDGSNPNAVVYNTKCVLSDEAGYLAALNELRSLMDSHDFKDVKINCYRVTAGRSDFSHLVSLNCPSKERLAAMLDAVSTEAWAQGWVASAGKYRTVVANGTYREITSGN